VRRWFTRRDLDDVIDRREQRTRGQAVRAILGIDEFVTTLRQGIVLHLQGRIKGVRQLGKGIVLHPDRL
jgi:hypothetical protein